MPADDQATNPNDPLPASQASEADVPNPDQDAIDDLLTDCLERFLEAWEANGFGPGIREYLPASSAAVRRLALIELIKVDMENRYQMAGPVLQLEDYLEEHPELAVPDGVPVDLIYEEFHVRQAAGETIISDEWLRRFPDKADQVRALLQLETVSSEQDSLTGTQLNQIYQPGDRLGDFYLMSVLGTGAFGSVFLARQESMQRTVALKVSADKGQEAQTLAKLDHPNIVRVYDQAKLPKQNVRLLYMQFAAGGTLQSVVRAARSSNQKTGKIVADCIAAALEHTGVLTSDNVTLKAGLADKSWPEVTCQLGMELAQALQYAHDQGILHRDVKPANVLLTANGTARLADFNISFSAQTEGSTPAAYFGGSLAYMSPEQLEAFDPTRPTQPSDLDQRCDIYSLGVLLWELLYGSRPFPDDDLPNNSYQMLTRMIEVRQHGSVKAPCPPDDSVEARLLAILQRCLRPNPNDRYQAAAELADDLGLCLQPRVAKLIHESETGWRRMASCWPMTAFLLAAIGPHSLAAVFNFFYNDVEIREQLQPVVQQQFIRIVVAINAIAFPIGFAFCIGYSLPVVRAIRRSRRDATSARPPSRDSKSATGSSTPGPSESNVSAKEVNRAVRLRAFRLSRFVTVLGITEWLIAGLVYPIALHAVAGDLAVKWYAHFIGSLLICGLVAAAYPFFVTATLMLRAFLPTLLKSNPLNSADLLELRRLSTQSVWSLYLAGGVPAAGIMILLFTQEATNPNSAFALKVLSFVGAVGFAIALSLSRSLQSDIEALQQAARRLTQED